MLGIETIAGQGQDAAKNGEKADVRILSVGSDGDGVPFHSHGATAFLLFEVKLLLNTLNESST